MEDLSPVPTVKQEAKVMSFYDALREIVDNKRRATRLEWSSNDEYAHILEDGRLYIHTQKVHPEGKSHPWILQTTDIEAIDWCLLPEQTI